MQFVKSIGVFIGRRIQARVQDWTAEWEYSRDADRLRSATRGLLLENERLRSLHAGRRAFVIGNGPSITVQDLTSLSSEVTFVANGFYKHPVTSAWQPTYYLLTDPAYFDGSSAAAIFFAELRERITDTTFILPHTARAVVESDHLLDGARVQYCVMAGSLASARSWEPDLSRVIPGVQTVVQLGIIAAMFMGCTSIYLIGLDHDWLAHRGEHTAFYTGREISTAKSVGDWKYKNLMEAVLTMWHGYESILACAQRRGVLVQNATREGFLDVFERVPYESLIQPKHQHC